MTSKEFRKSRKINNRMKRKLALMFTLIVLALVGLSIRIVYINKTNGDKYTKKVLAQQESNSLTLAYRRGDIYDRNGTVLATSEKVYNLILDPKVLSANEEREKGCVSATLKALSEHFYVPKDNPDEELSLENLKRIYKEKIKSSYVVLEKKLTKDQISGFKKEMEKKKSKIKGVWFEEAYQRKYPYEELGCNVIGYTVSGNVGQYGIEESYSKILNGIDGRSYTYLDESMEQEKIIHEPVNGSNIMSTIDVTLQKFVEEEIDKFMEQYKDAFREGDGAKTAACVMMDPRNGEILAMASNRKYDLNHPFDLVANGFCSEEEVETLKAQGDEFEKRKEEGTLTEEERKAGNPYFAKLNDMWRNFCVSDTYEPGSTVKPVTIAAGLESGVLSGNESFVCDGAQVAVQGQKPIHCAKRTGHGLISLEGALMFSCNDALMQIASKLGYDLFVEYQRLFNFGLKTGIDLPGESRTDTVVYYVGDDAPYENLKIGPAELATCSFGQGFNTSMIQVASAFSACINGGNYYQPHVVKKIMDSNGGTVEEIQGNLLRKPISGKTSDLLRTYLYHTMYGEKDANGNSATGKKARIAGYAMGGKTGTAQKIPRGSGNYLVSFIGFAPYENPQVVCYVIVDEPNAAYQPTSAFAQEIWKGIMQKALPYLNIYETEEPPEDMIDEYNETHPQQEEPDEGASEGEASDTQEGEKPEEQGTLIDPQTGEEVKLPDLSDDESIDPETGMLKDLSQDDAYPSGAIESVQTSPEEEEIE